MKKKVWRVVFIVSLVLCVAILGYIIYIFFGGNIYNNLKPSISSPTGSLADSSEDVPLIDNPIDFAYYQNINPEVYAWIEIPDTQINYPILQSTGDRDDNYYLNHDIYGNYSAYGAIYTQNGSIYFNQEKDFSSRNTVIYGHDMLNGSMFQNLHKFNNAEFFEQNRYCYIYTPGHKLTYEIFSAYRYDDRHIMISFDFNDDKVYSDYLYECLHPKFMNAHVREGVSLSISDRIITLSTCYGYGDARYLVQGVLINDERTK